MAKIVQVKLGDKKYWAYRRFNWKGFKFEYLDVAADDVWHGTWWDSGTVYFRDCLCENKDDLEVALGLKERKPIEKETPEISEPTQSIIRAIENRPDDFLFSKFDTCGGVFSVYVVDRKTKLRLHKIEENKQFDGIKTLYMNNKDILFFDNEYKLIEEKLKTLYNQRVIQIQKKEAEEARKQDLIRQEKDRLSRDKLTQKLKEYENA